MNKSEMIAGSDIYFTTITLRADTASVIDQTP